MSNLQHVWNPLLSQIAVDFKNREYIAEEVLTPVGVPAMYGRYLVWDQGATFKIPQTMFQQDGSPNMLQLKATTANYGLEARALAAYIDELEESQAPMAQIQAMKTTKLVNAIKLDMEIAVAAQLCSTTVMTNHATLSGSDQWSNSASHPIAAIQAIADTLPTRPNTLILGREVVTQLRKHADVLDAIKYTQTGGFAPLNALATLFGDEMGLRILIGDAFKDTAADGQAASLTRIWGKNAILAYVDRTPPSALMDQPTLGYLPTLTGGAPAIRVYSARDPHKGTGAGRMFIKAETVYKPLVSAPTMGYLWAAAVA